MVRLLSTLFKLQDIITAGQIFDNFSRTNMEISGGQQLDRIFDQQKENEKLNDTDGLEPLMQRTTAELVLGTLTYVVIIVMTICGNFLVVMAVFNYRPLKKVQNYFLVSLAAADLAVATLVMPLHVVKFLAGGKWLLGMTVCQMFTTFDILCCTASILNLCAIALDRYWAIHNPIDYAQKRTLRLVGGMIFAVWLVSGLISIPPLIGWNDWSTRKLKERCELTTEKAFVVFSASGSFFVPLAIMMFVYFKIFIAARQRIRTNRGRSAFVKISKMSNQAGSVVVHSGIEAHNENNMHLHPLTNENAVIRTETTPLVKSLSVRTNMETALSSANDICEDANSAEMEQEGKRRPSKAADRLRRLMRPQSAGGSLKSTKGGMSNGWNMGSLLDRKKMSKCSVPSLARSSRTRQSEMSTVSEAAHTLQSQATTTSLLKRREKISVAKEKKAAKTLAVIMGVFVLCWLPFFLMYVIVPFCSSCSLHPKVAEAITWLGYINSAINPVIYTIFNLDFRRAFERFLCPLNIRRKRRFSNAANN